MGRADSRFMVNRKCKRMDEICTGLEDIFTGGKGCRFDGRFFGLAWSAEEWFWEPFPRFSVGLGFLEALRYEGRVV